MSSKEKEVQSLSSELSAENWCLTKRKFNPITFSWKILNFMDSPEETGEYFCSSEFPDDDNSSKWKLMIYPRGDSMDTKDNVSLFLVLVSCKRTYVYAKAKMCILDRNRKEWKVTHLTTSKFYESEDSGWGFSKFCWRNFLTDYSILHKKGALLIYCQVMEMTDPIHTSGYKSTSSNVPCIKNDLLLNNSSTISENQVLTDVILISADGQEFPAHKNVLSVRSPVFAAMFQDEMEKNLKVEIADMTKKVLQGMLKYIYYGKVPEGITEDLVAAADKYGLDDLKQKCEEHRVNQVIDLMKKVAIDFVKTEG